MYVNGWPMIDILIVTMWLDITLTVKGYFVYVDGSPVSVLIVTTCMVATQICIKGGLCVSQSMVGP